MMLMSPLILEALVTLVILSAIMVKTHTLYKKKQKISTQYIIIKESLTDKMLDQNNPKPREKYQEFADKVL
ncbi:hypothetical protein C2G38_2254945 [Gigaspora rosea]|uniref:Uncharacterized protein n=1 Tax=Gigaspora rosea TaxID=44941 RepID=A0A397U2Y8_9GLOM|nr:hypothetical protein C2G38_2254945 [Gigaspora rosea]